MKKTVTKKAADRKVRPEKEAMVGELRSRLAAATYLFLADYRGMNSGRTMELRRRLRKAGARFQVVPNRMFRKSNDGHDVDPAALAGPTAMVVGTGDAVEVAKTLTGFAKEFEKLAIKGGALEGRRLSAEDIRSLARLPAKPVMQAMLLGTLAAPMSRLVGVFSRKLASLVYVLQAVAEKKEKAAAQG